MPAEHTHSVDRCAPRRELYARPRTSASRPLSGDDRRRATSSRSGSAVGARGRRPPRRSPRILSLRPGSCGWRRGGPMKLGVDFGTTRIIAAAVDRGNYPILTFDTREGAADWFPSLVALRGPERRYGWDAWAMQGEPGWTTV